jgi:hypothetical protein
VKELEHLPTHAGTEYPNKNEPLYFGLYRMKKKIPGGKEQNDVDALVVDTGPHEGNREIGTWFSSSFGKPFTCAAVWKFDQHFTDSNSRETAFVTLKAGLAVLINFSNQKWIWNLIM